MWFHWFIHIKFHFSLGQHSNVTTRKCLISISLQLLNSHLECAAFIRNPVISRCHNPAVLNWFLQHWCGPTPTPKQCYASWEHATLQLLLSKFAFEAFSRYWIMLHKCKSNRHRVETKCFFFPEEDSLPTSITNRRLTPKPRSESNLAASQLSHTHRWLPSSLFKAFREERCVLCCGGSCCCHWD